MLTPLTRKAFEQLVPAVATGAQYAYCWGKLPDLLSRVLISVVGMFAVLLVRLLILQEGFDEILLTIGITVGLYWLWGPVLWASLRNREYRKYGYCGFWQGKVLDVFISEELVGTEETVNKRGDLVVVENRERCLNLVVGDESGFSTELRVPLKRSHRAIDIGDHAEMLVFSNRGDLGRIARTSDIYLPDHNLWVSDYPAVQREAFVEISRRLDTYQPVDEPLPRTARPAQKRTPRTSAASKPSSSSSFLTRRDDSRSREFVNPGRSDWEYDQDEEPFDQDRDRPSRPSRRRPKTDW
ncbi:phosphate ABC transporter permease [Leptodesmis sp.]|uniref:phosphate ABC transporter permease n=1 Tax=Leptodesmis sp. TaxID=3100501 RepID=UPI0040535717